MAERAEHQTSYIGEVMTKTGVLGVNYPLVCPFCDEPAMMRPFYNKVVLPHKIYTLRQCPMGHEFYSVEYVPENQSEIAAQIKEIQADAKEWRKQLRKNVN